MQIKILNAMRTQRATLRVSHEVESIIITWTVLQSVQWCPLKKGGYRYSETLVRSNTNNYSETIVHVVEDIVFCCMHSFNMVAFMECFCCAFEKYPTTRILNADSTSEMVAQCLDYR